MKLIQRALTKEETLSLHQTIKESKHIISFPPEKWLSFQNVYIAENNQGNFVGACIISRTGPYYKLGPLAIIKEHQGKSYGKKIIEKIIKKYPQRKYVVGSSNPKVVSIVDHFGFKKVKHRQIFLSIGLYLFKYFLSVMSVSYLIEAIKKNLLQKRGKYRIFLKEEENNHSNHEFY
ncbi:MAG: GNAT family N-acetyltransferase [Patescibacteria group bacterium]|nr:GNAT family N-acetyltransferase [Patescibacteria group bacterium]